MEERMQKLIGLSVLAATALFATHVSAQEKAKSADVPKPVPAEERKSASEKSAVPLKVTVIFNEYDGEKKVSSLPYVLFLRAAEPAKSYIGTVRMGVRVPVWIGGKDSAIQYEDVGSNIDCDATAAPDERYLLELRLERSSIYSAPDEHAPEQKSGDEPHQPMLRNFRGNLALMLRDAQTAQSMVATDPLNGHTLRVDVTLNVLK
jgi:hypothetical protein